MIFIELAVAIVILFGTFCGLNHKNMIPGTDRYIDSERQRQIEMEIHMTRQNLVLSRLRLKESENIDKIVRQLPIRSEVVSSVNGNNGGEDSV